MRWFYMGIAQIVLDPPIPSVKQANMEKSAPNHPGKPLHPRAMWENKCTNPSWQAFTAPPRPLTGNAIVRMETTHFKKGLP